MNKIFKIILLLFLLYSNLFSNSYLASISFRETNQTPDFDNMSMKEASDITEEALKDLFAQLLDGPDRGVRLIQLSS